MNPRLGLALAGLLLAGRAGAAVPGAAEPYRGIWTEPGIIRIWGDPGLADLAQIWERAYVRLHPEIVFENRLISTAMAMPGISTGVADLAFLGREPNVEDHDGFVHVRAYEPTRFELATGSLATPGKSAALAVLVRADNPLSRLTLAQLDALFGYERRRGGRAIRTWGDLGLEGARAGHPIRLYVCDVESGTGQYFLHTVLLGSNKLNWERVTEFVDRRDAKGGGDPAGAQITAALLKDPDGLAVGSLAFASPGVKTVALASRDEGPFVRPTRETVADRSYPLTRVALAYLNRVPGQPIDPKVNAFLEFVYSLEGQAGIADEGAFIPLPEPVRQAQEARLRSAR